MTVKKCLTIALIISLATMLALGLFAGLAEADEKVVTLIFEWDQEDTHLDKWEIHWGDAAGGPYEMLIELPYTGGGPTHMAVSDRGNGYGKS